VNTYDEQYRKPSLQHSWINSWLDLIFWLLLCILTSFRVRWSKYWTDCHLTVPLNQFY
jgi:hypothetical protein